MDEHAKAVAGRWANYRAEAIAEGEKPEDFDAYMLRVMRGYGWSEENAQAICKRAKRLCNEKGVDACENS